MTMSDTKQLKVVAYGHQVFNESTNNILYEMELNCFWKFFLKFFLKFLLVLSIVLTVLFNWYVYKIHQIHNVAGPAQTTTSRLTLLILCHDKILKFKETLESLMKVRGIEMTDIVVSQSGDDMRVTEIAESFGLKVIQHLDNVNIEKRLSRHFQWSFNAVFDMYPDSDGLVVVEDDLLFSPDFLEYFHLTIPLLSSDPKLFSVSAWNDIGFKSNTHDLHAIKRVTFFPGLGWYLTRDMWKNRLDAIWPQSDWDWVVRKFIVDNDLEIVVPEISRDYHAADHGTYMKKDLFNKYFKNINYNVDEDFRWDDRDLIPVLNYENHVVNMFHNDIVEKVWIVDERGGSLRSRSRTASKTASKTNYALVQKYGVWHEPDRGSWRGIRIVWGGQNYVMLIDTRTHPKWTPFQSSMSM